MDDSDSEPQILQAVQKGCKTMGNDDKEFEGIISAVSKKAGTVAGTSVAISKKIAGGGAKTMVTAKDLLKWPLKVLTPENNEKNGTTSEESISESQDEQENVRKSAAKALIETLEMDLAGAERELENAQSEAEKTQSKLTLQLSELKADKESLISEIDAFEQAKNQANETAIREGEMKARIAALESDLTVAQHHLEKYSKEELDAQSKLTLQLSELKTDKESLISEISDFEQAKSQANETAIREGELKARIAALESDLAVAQHHVEKYSKEELDAQYQPPSDLSDIKQEEEVALSDWGQEEIEIVSTEEKVESAMEPTAAQSVGVLTKIEEQPSQPVSEVDQADIPAVTKSQVETAVFPHSTDNVMFTRVLSDIDSENVKTRATAVKVIGSIRHQLSVRTLVTQLTRETSPQVRQECIKALTRQEVNGGLQAVKRALRDPVASVRLAAVRGLYRLAGEESASDLVRMLSDENEEVRRRSATCIGWLGQEELAVELIPLLSNGNPSVRRAAIEAMGNLRSRQVISALIEHLNDSDKSIRMVIIEALEKITDKKMGPLPRNEKTLQRFIARWHEWWKDELLGQ